MNATLKNILAVLAGLILGNLVNMGLIILSGSVIPPPEGVDPQDVETIKAHIDDFEVKHFIFPFLAHALGTFIGAMTAARIAVSRKMSLAIGVGVIFLIGGIMMAFMVPAPTWFIVVDLALAYIPMAWIGGRLGSGRK